MSLPQSFGGPARTGIPPLEVRLLRNGIAESRHRVHAVVCDARGRVLMRAGDPQQLSFIRSAHKPFQATVFVASGSADQAGGGDRGLAIACASHAGTAMHAREAFRCSGGRIWRWISCSAPPPAGPPARWSTTAPASTRPFWPPAGDGLATRELPAERPPPAAAVLKRTGELLGLPAAELVSARDDCGAPTLQLQLAQMALLFAHLGGGQQPTSSASAGPCSTTPIWWPGRGASTPS
jgi:L-asparaginase